MKGETIDDQVNTGIRANPFYWMGIGAFFWLCITGYGYIFKAVIKDVCLLSSVQPEFTFWASNIGKLVILCSLILLFLARYERTLQSTTKPKKILTITIIAFAISQAVQFFYMFYFQQYAGMEYYANMINYVDTINRIDFFATFYETGFSTLLFIFVGVIFYRKGAKLW